MHKIILLTFIAAFCFSEDDIVEIFCKKEKLDHENQIKLIRQITVENYLSFFSKIDIDIKQIQSYEKVKEDKISVINEWKLYNNYNYNAKAILYYIKNYKTMNDAEKDSVYRYFVTKAWIEYHLKPIEENTPGNDHISFEEFKNLYLQVNKKWNFKTTEKKEKKPIIVKVLDKEQNKEQEKDNK